MAAMHPRLNLHLDRSAGPLYRQISDQIGAQILSGRLPAGSRIPAERELAERLNVNRSTVMNAYAELAADGLIEAHVGRGTIVRQLLPGEEDELVPLPWEALLAQRNNGNEDPMLQDVIALSGRSDLISLAAGIPAPELYPTADFARCVAEALAQPGPAALLHSPSEGYWPLRAWLAGCMRATGANVDTEQVIITAGSQQGLYLLGQTLLEPGDAVICEAPTYLGALQVFRAAGARLISVPSDQQGMRIDALARTLQRVKPKLIYVLPTLRNPTGATLSLEQRQELLALAARHGVPVVEDDPYGWLAENAPPPLLGLDTGNRVVYLSTFSKVLFPGLRVGWMVTPVPLAERIVSLCGLIDLHTATLAQMALHDFCATGLLDVHLQRIRPAYARRAEILRAALAKHCNGWLTVQSTSGGFYLWCRLAEGLASRALLPLAAAEGVTFIAGPAFYPNREGESWLRLNFTYAPEEQLEEAARRLGRALARLALARVRPASRQSERQPLV